MSGKKGYLVLPSVAINKNANCQAGPWSSPLWMACSPANTYRVMLFQPTFPSTVTGVVAATLTRSDGPSPAIGNGGTGRYQTGVIVNQTYRYRLAFAAGRAPTSGTDRKSVV